MVNIFPRELIVLKIVLLSMFVDLLKQITWDSTVDKLFGDENPLISRNFLKNFLEFPKYFWFYDSVRIE